MSDQREKEEAQRRRLWDAEAELRKLYLQKGKERDTQKVARLTREIGLLKRQLKGEPT